MKAPFYYINWDINTNEDVEISVEDRNHIFDMIDNGFICGEICTNENTRGYWAIDKNDKYLG